MVENITQNLYHCVLFDSLNHSISTHHLMCATFFAWIRAVLYVPKMLHDFHNFVVILLMVFYFHHHHVQMEFSYSHNISTCVDSKFNFITASILKEQSQPFLILNMQAFMHSFKKGFSCSWIAIQYLDQLLWLKIYQCSETPKIENEDSGLFLQICI